MGEYVDIHGMSKLIRASDLNPSNRRIARNNADADILESQGYRVERGKHENGAYFAIIGDHPQHEIEVGRIFAENGISLTLDKEGMRVKVKGTWYSIPSPDGRLNSIGKRTLYHEITSVRLIFTKAKADGHLPVFD